MMQLVTFTNNINSTEEFDNAATNNPVLRKQRIIECLRKNIDNFRLIEIKEEDGIDFKLYWLEKIHDRKYLDFLSRCYDSFAKSSDVSWSDCNKGLVPCNFYKSIPNSSISLQNEKTILELWSRIPIYKLSGFYGSDVMTPIYKTTWSNALISANQAFIAASHLHDNPTDLAYVLATSPGHHAKTSEYGGYCFINNAIIAAHRLIELDDKRNIAILDVDYHAGNGTYEMSLKSTNIHAYSIHCDPAYDYPSFDGFSDEYNYVLGPHTDWNNYELILKTVLEKIMAKNIDILIIAFGGDTFKDDPDAISIGRFGLELTSYSKMGKTIREYFPDTPIMITQEGGYNMEHIGTIVSNFIQGLII